MDLQYQASNPTRDGLDIFLEMQDFTITGSQQISKTAISLIISKLSLVLGDVSLYRHLLNYKDDYAQKVLDIMQFLLLYVQELEPGFRRNLIVAVQRLSQKSNLYPTCLELDQLQLVGEIPVAAGSFADVYRGVFEEYCVCVKVVRVYQTSNVEHLFKRFSKEAILWGQLSHPNLLPFYGLYRVRSRMCLVSPWMKNGPITSYLLNNPDVDRVLLAFDITAGVSYLHRNNVVHGDLKGANILVTDGGRACLADFGLSSITDPEILNWTSHSSASSKGGSLRWQAPELLDIDDDHVPNSKESDVYALGCVYYETFTGKIPFVEVPRDASVMLKIQSGIRPIRPPSASPAWTAWGLTESIWTVMQECWREDPGSRPQVDEVLCQFYNMRPEDPRPAEDPNVGYPSRFRESLRRSIDLEYDLEDTDTFILPSINHPGLETRTDYPTGGSRRRVRSDPFLRASSMRTSRSFFPCTQCPQILASEQDLDHHMYAHAEPGNSFRDKFLKLKTGSAIRLSLLGKGTKPRRKPNPRLYSLPEE